MVETREEDDGSVTTTTRTTTKTLDAGAFSTKGLSAALEGNGGAHDVVFSCGFLDRFLLSVFPVSSLRGVSRRREAGGGEVGKGE